MEKDLLHITGQVLNVQHFCTSDGPGIRTTVFLKGCPLRCAWCHNPETHESCSQLLYRASKCRACAACVAVCPTGAHTVTPAGEHLLDRSLCRGCGACAAACPFTALEYAGSSLSVGEILPELLADRIFYETSGGGITVSGGEPTAQPIFTAALLRACHEEGLQTAMETSGVCSEETLLSLIPHTDLFLLDWKLWDDALHKQYTKVSNHPVLATLALLNEHQKTVHLRCPLIPDVNTTEAHYDSIVALAEKYPVIKEIELEPYHPLGVTKAEALGVEAAYQRREFMERSESELVKQYIEERTCVPVSLGST